MSKSPVYIFLDEAGNFDFSKTGTEYFILTSLTKMRPFNAGRELIELKYDCIEKGIHLEYFHASEDRQFVRNEVFNIIRDNIEGIRLDALVVEKSKTGYALQKEEKFYPKMFHYLLSYVINQISLEKISELIIFTDTIPIQRKRKMIEKAIKKTVKENIAGRVPYKLLHHASKSNFDLQIVDYCNWAIYRKWESKDDRSYCHINSVIKSEYEIFKDGDRHYY